MLNPIEDVPVHYIRLEIKIIKYKNDYRPVFP